MNFEQPTYDCTPHPKPEPVVHHVARVVHNLFHPHRKQHFIAPMALVCKVPEMETVTITAGNDAPPDIQMPPDTPGFHGGGGSVYGYGTIYSTGIPIGVEGGHYRHPVAVPEPGAWVLMLPALLAVMLVNRRKLLCPKK